MLFKILVLVGFQKHVPHLKDLITIHICTCMKKNSPIYPPLCPQICRNERPTKHLVPIKSIRENPRGKAMHTVTTQQQQPSTLNRGQAHLPIEASFAQSLVEACPVIVGDVAGHKGRCRRQ
ncbi:hypothetical protein CDAR_608901 [Caerostris darwini]|uniref:Uncharacterized protein n=1 Tax=Caerostris darwini TaxID=1538125 RepID=A0AAV4WKQ0_9ARAC|nr:hypothetical protein CDAR_544231 [Caerostris darwini]GIY82809.1 hypothetical protein CDAR_608901 [Caerostris darwini]